MYDKNVSSYTNMYSEISKYSTKSIAIIERIHDAMLQWVTTMPQSVKSQLRAVIPMLNLDHPLRKDDAGSSSSSPYSVRYMKLKLESSAKFPTEESIVNWIYNCPCLGRRFYVKTPLLGAQQSEIRQLAEQERNEDNNEISKALEIMINGDINTKPVYRSLKSVLEKIIEQ